MAPSVGELQHVVVAEPRAPRRGTGGAISARITGRCVELDGVALAVGEADGLDARVALERPGEADRGVLAAGEQYERPRHASAACRPFAQNPARTSDTRPITSSTGTKPTPKRGDCTRLSVEL